MIDLQMALVLLTYTAIIVGGAAYCATHDAPWFAVLILLIGLLSQKYHATNGSVTIKQGVEQIVGGRNE